MNKEWNPPPGWTPDGAREYGAAVAAQAGRYLRQLRERKGMSLDRVQEISGGRWTAAAVGAYERGDRHILVEYLAGLAEFYGADIRDLLPFEAPRAVA